MSTANQKNMLGEKKTRSNEDDARERARERHHAQQALAAAPYKQNGDADKRENAPYMPSMSEAA